MGEMLQLKKISKRFGGLEALHEVDLTVQKGQIFSVIGPNGSGKTTLLNTITGIYEPSQGEILFDGKSILSKPSHEITFKGIGRTFQTIRLFPEMSVKENVMVGCHCRTRANLFNIVFRTKSMKKEEKKIEEKALEKIYFVGLEKETDLMAKNLSHGDQRLLELARALATDPALLVLDEPSAGMNEAETKVLMEYIRKIKEMGVTVLLVEHDMNLVMTMSERIAVFNFGKKIAEGAKDTIQHDEGVIEAYLGKGTKYA